MKSFFKYFYRIFFPSYILFSFFTLTNCTRNSDDEKSYSSFLEQINQTKQKLINDFHAKYFDCKEINTFLNQKVVLDTTLVGIVEKNSRHYLKASINIKCNQKVYALLQCSNEFLNEYEKFKSNRAFIVASIKKVDNIKTIVEADSLDGRLNFENQINSIFLTADCLAISEIPFYSGSD